jgi:spore germination protein YaaH
MYTPLQVNPAQPTQYTTTASPAGPTGQGTIANCGRYYSVQPGDICYSIALNFTITFDEFLGTLPPHYIINH